MDEADPFSAAQVVGDVHDGLGHPLEARRIRLAEQLPQVVAPRHRFVELVHMDSDYDAREIGIVDHLQQPDHECVAVLLRPAFELTLKVGAVDRVEDLDWPLRDIPALCPILPLLAARDICRNGQNGRTVMEPDSSIGTLITPPLPLVPRLNPRAVEHRTIYVVRDPADPEGLGTPGLSGGPDDVVTRGHTVGTIGVHSAPTGCWKSAKTLYFGIAFLRSSPRVTGK